MTCFFIGHRDAPSELRPLLDEAVERHILQYGVTEFTVGHYGAFDAMAAKSVIAAKERHPEVTLTLLLPYHPFDRPVPTPEGFDRTFYPPGMELVPKRAAILRANQYMISNSDCLIAYDRRLIGNTRELVDAAKRRAVRGLMRVENLAEEL